ncbi:DUF6446 family protein [Sedimentitalea todarodis]|uniref:DUF6446 family protein n=1 Tax=Sedimentitalea todarodis TaxID=1631240 RepID=A0ABU3VFB3_9RHOB|nr:DUF6446 family protein [Sedimentitalea todarodis]MDU9004877.1 DUF6446 family protein [Sedimentitalea todarodis]
MTLGRIIILLLLFCALAAGAALYYLQVFGYYDAVEPDPGRDVLLVSRASVTPEPISYDGFQAIDAESSPIRYRACFTTTAGPETLALSYESVADATPRNAPFWFDCFDAEAIAEQIRAGTAQVFLGSKNVHYGVDRLVAITADGRGYIWHELNNCGAKAYDGTVVGEECPPHDTASD